LNAAALALDERLPGRHSEIVAATERLRQTLGAAVTDYAGTIDVGTAAGTLAFALRQLLQETAPEDAMAALLAQGEAGSAQGAVLGTLLGARRGLDALPASWLVAAETLAVRDLADFVESGPFLGWGRPGIR
jgi:ADP-ribosylglycohydrolase